MTEPTLELTLTIKADEKTLRDIDNLLVDNPALTDKLAEMIKHTLASAALTNDFEVELQDDQLVISHYLNELTSHLA